MHHHQEKTVEDATHRGYLRVEGHHADTAENHWWWNRRHRRLPFAVVRLRGNTADVEVDLRSAGRKFSEATLITLKSSFDGVFAVDEWQRLLNEEHVLLKGVDVRRADDVIKKLLKFAGPGTIPHP
jgi:hypothetical protein